MKKIVLIIILPFFVSYGQNENNPNKTDLKNLGFLEGKWKAMAKDSSFKSILEYRFSPEGKLLLSTNHLYGRNGQIFRIYEGVYLVEGSNIIYVVAGPGGETHQGKAIVKKDSLVHLAKIIPESSIKSYRSELIHKNGKLIYYANYSKESEFPDTLEYKNPLIYHKL